MARILVVDDSKEIRTLVSLYLAKAGHFVATAKNPIDAFANVNAQEFDLIILDIQMPRGNGIDYAKSLTRTLGDSRPKLVFLSATKERDGVSEAIKIKPDAYILKPFKKGSFLSVVDRVLESRSEDNLADDRPSSELKMEAKLIESRSIEIFKYIVKFKASNGGKGTLVNVVNWSKRAVFV